MFVVISVLTSLTYKFNTNCIAKQTVKIKEISCNLRCKNCAYKITFWAREVTARFEKRAPRRHQTNGVNG